MIDPATERFRQVALMASTSVLAWAEAAGLEPAEAHVLLALSCGRDSAGAAEIAAVCRLSFDEVYPALHHLAARGYAHEEHRRYRLTDGGRRVIDAFDRDEGSRIEAY